MFARLLGGLFLVAVITTSAPGEAKSLLDDIKGALNTGSLTGSDGGGASRLEELQANPGDGPCGGHGAASLLHARVEQGFGVIDAPALDRYLNGILAKLIAVSPRPDCRVHVRVTPHDTAQAVALDDGGILVAIGFLRNLQSEDEVAALLAHELTHVLLGHHASDAFLDTQDELLKGIDSANVAGGMLLGAVDPGLTDKLDKLDKAAVVGGGIYSVSENMIAPAWTRGQEDDADLLGIDLMAAAGYNPSAMGKLMDVIAVQEELAAKVEEEKARMHQNRVKETTFEAVKKTDTSDAWSIISNVTKVVTVAAESMTKAKRTHKSAAERKENSSAYVREHHSKARRREYTEEPWRKAQSGEIFPHYKAASEARQLIHGGGDVSAAMTKAKSSIQGLTSLHAYPRLALSEARLKQGDRKGAMNALVSARERPDAPWQVYRIQIDLQLGTGDLKGAASTMAAADRALDQPLGITPFAIKVYRRTGDKQKVNYYLDRCNAAGKRALLDVCLLEAGVNKEQYMQEKLRR